MTSWSDFRKPTTSGSKLNELAETGAARHDGPANTGGLPAVRLVTRRRPPPDGTRRTRTGPRMAEVVETFRTKHMEVVAGTADRMADVYVRLVTAPAARRRTTWSRSWRGSSAESWMACPPRQSRRRRPTARGGTPLPTRARRERTPGHRVSCAPKSPFLEANGMAVICNQNFPCYFYLIDRI